MLLRPDEVATPKYNKGDGVNDTIKRRDAERTKLRKELNNKLKTITLPKELNKLESLLGERTAKLYYLAMGG